MTRDPRAAPTYSDRVVSRSLVKLLIDPVTGRVLDASQAAADFYGQSREDLEQRFAWDLAPERPREATLAWLAAVVTAQDPSPGPDERHRRHDGELRAVTVYPDHVEHQGRTLILVTVIDVTEQRRTEARLRQSEEHLRLAIQGAHLGTWHRDLDTQALSWSEDCRRILGFPPECPISFERFLAAVHLDDRSMLADTLQQAIVTQGGFSIEYRLWWPDGSLHWIGATAQVQPTADGQPKSLNGIVSDITARKQMEAALEAERAHLEERVRERTAELQASEAKLRTIYDVLPVGVAITDPAGRLVDCNHASERLLGLTRAAHLERTYDDPEWTLVRPDGTPMPPDEYASVRAMREGRAVRDVELGVVRAQGTTWLSVSAMPAEHPEYGVVIAYVDVTELHRARDAAEQATRIKSEFLAHMSHELRTPMNAVLGLLQVLERGNLAPEQRAMVRQVRNAGRSLMGILDDILDLSKIEAGHLPLDARPFSLVPLLAEIDALMGTTARDKGLTLAITPLPTLAGGVMEGLIGDPLRLEQVLVNLVGNAIKFTERGEVRLDVSTLDCTPERVRLRFAVSDTGIGIAPEVLAGLFTPFTQADSGITRRFGGTGLGLSICKRLVELMGGAIGADSDEGTGSTFWCELPFARTAEAPALAPTAPAGADASGPRLAGRHLLVVDDSAMNREVVTQMLALEGARATPATNGQEALDLLRAAPLGFDAVLMDVQMPGMDGLTAARLIRTEPGLTELPILALTAGVLPEQQAAARAAGMNAVLTKPLDAERLVAVLSRWVAPRPECVAPVPPTAASPAEADTFPEIPGIDRVGIARALRGNQTLFLDLLDRFAADCGGLVATTRQALAAGNRLDATQQMHGLRGNAGIVGALEIMASATALEDAIARGETDLDGPLDALAARLAALITASAHWRQTR